MYTLMIPVGAKDRRSRTPADKIDKPVSLARGFCLPGRLQGRKPIDGITKGYGGCAPACQQEIEVALRDRIIAQVDLRFGIHQQYLCITEHSAVLNLCRRENAGIVPAKIRADSGQDSD